jgi:transcriptional regulator with XRE-family HTH domain
MQSRTTFREPLDSIGFTVCERYDAAVAAKDVIRKRLLAAHVRPMDLASALGVSKQLASMMLSGQRGIGPKYFERVAALLNVSVAQLFTHSDLPDHPEGVGFASIPAVLPVAPLEVGGHDVSTLAASAPVRSVASSEIAINHALEFAARLVAIADTLRDIAAEIAGRQAATVGDLETERPVRARQARRRSAR